MTTTLLEAGCNIDNVNGSGITPVQVAVEEGNFRILRLLLWWGCNLRACENISYVIMKCCIQHRDRHPHAELQPIFVICKFQDVRLMKLLLQCYHQLPYNLIHAVHDVLTIGFGPNSMFNQRVNEEMVQILRDAMTEARPLKDLCRGAIRKALGVRPFSKIDDLPVPNSMKNYILMTEELGKDLPQEDEIIERDDMFESYEVPPTEE
ncbi:ankyrin repeat and SOCS box protein 1 [Lingula anatina]|uniref:Ankyrin repeat and SOCS box protein 1 n=1 Tax=Lingula anatina TaxID=7574 RepID=A0A2R2MPN3_LINAN|nr:ankyrin repeat and SOCS box protein 1 [Lingula anatina]|eukprot:XP_023932195.1 ankyrin repeat and SOCS box protein 1 [Lingula anatina]